VFMLVLRWGFSTTAALFAASAYGLAGPAWSYATLFMSHGVTAGCLMVAFCGAVLIRDVAPERRIGVSALVGLACGWAVVTEFQAAVPAAAFFAIALVELYRLDRARFSQPASAAVAGGAVCAIVLLAYNTLAFGSPLHLGYSSEQGFEHLRSGFFGITYPEWWRVREILVGGYRGLVPLAPLVAAGPIGLVLLGRDPRRRVAAVAALGVGAYYLLLNASYYYWEGGWSYAPRQLTPALPFIALGLAPLWDARGRVVRALLAAGWIWGAAVTLVAVSTNPQPPSSFKVPMAELLWPAFRDGDLSLNHQTFVHGSASPDQMRGNQIPHAAWNLGEIMGLRGHASLLPLAAIWVAGALALISGPPKGGHYNP